MAFTHARLRRPAGDGAVALHCAEAPPLAPPEKHPSSLASSQLAAHEQPSLPQRPAGLSCLTSRGRQAAAFSPPRWLPHGRRQSEQRRARAYCPVHPPPAAPELNHLFLLMSSNDSRKLDRDIPPRTQTTSPYVSGGLEGAPTVMVVDRVFRFKLRLWTSGSARTKGPHETASNCMGVGRWGSILYT